MAFQSSPTKKNSIEIRRPTKALDLAGLESFRTKTANTQGCWLMNTKSISKRNQCIAKCQKLYARTLLEKVKI